MHLSCDTKDVLFWQSIEWRIRSQTEYWKCPMVTIPCLLRGGERGKSRTFFRNNVFITPKHTRSSGGISVGKRGLCVKDQHYFSISSKQNVSLHQSPSTRQKETTWISPDLSLPAFLPYPTPPKATGPDPYQPSAHPITQRAHISAKKWIKKLSKYTLLQQRQSSHNCPMQKPFESSISHKICIMPCILKVPIMGVKS